MRPTNIVHEPASESFRPARGARARCAAHAGFSRACLLLLPACLLGCATAGTPPPAPGARTLSLESAEGLRLLQGRAEQVTHDGRRGLRLRALDQVGPDDVVLAIVDGLEFQDGEIAVEVSGAPLPDAPADMRGFIGVSFHVSADGVRSEDMYLRPSNGRSEEQLRRNHAVQYASTPDYPWHRLRKESPGE
ncbi:MAG TPA: hypothetical protein VGF31_02195, partial [Myxococcaceae bacterium]